MQSVTRLATAVLAVAFVAVSLAAEPDPTTSQEPSGQAKQVLIVTGEDYVGHKWQETAPVLKEDIEADSRLRVTVLDDLKRLATANLGDYDAVVMHFKNYDPNVPGRTGFENLERFVRQGGGLVVVHFACGAFEESKQDFGKLAGQVWFGAKPPAGRFQHDPRGPFTVHITDHNHPITNGLDDFTTTDELYTCLEGDTPITTLATATSVNDKKAYPMAFELNYGKGRVFHTPLGHDVEAFRSPGAANLICRGTAWVAGLEPRP